jgi:hypothetical protein
MAMMFDTVQKHCVGSRSVPAGRQSRALDWIVSLRAQRGQWMNASMVSAERIVASRVRRAYGKSTAGIARVCAWMLRVRASGVRAVAARGSTMLARERVVLGCGRVC